jgi:hypothetical protein
VNYEPRVLNRFVVFTTLQIPKGLVIVGVEGEVQVFNEDLEIRFERNTLMKNMRVAYSDGK